MHDERTLGGESLRSGAVGGGPGVWVNFVFPRRAVIGFVLITALLAFEVFNFDTTRYALQDLLGDVSFMGLGWASILAIAFCAIDFAGLARIFTPEQGDNEPRAVWYLMGAWLLGATMNAIMTWWAVNLTLLNHDFGNEVLSREQLLRVVPLFVAVLVWLTRILFIGAFSVAGEHLFDLAGQDDDVAPQRQRQPQRRPRPVAAAAEPGLRLVRNEGPSRYRPSYAQAQAQPTAQRDRSAPPVVEEQKTQVWPSTPNRGVRRPMPAAMQARSDRSRR